MFLPLLDLTAGSPLCSSSAAFFGYMGVACALIFSNLGSAYGAGKAGK